MDTSTITQGAMWQAQNAMTSGQSARALQQTATAGGNIDMARTRKAAQEFEGFFVGQMMEYMMASMKPDENFGGGQAEQTWRSMLNAEYGKEVAKTGKLGIADKVMRSMLQMQEQRTKAQEILGAQASTTPSADQINVMQAAAAAGSMTPAAKLDVKI